MSALVYLLYTALNIGPTLNNCSFAGFFIDKSCEFSISRLVVDEMKSIFINAATLNITLHENVLYTVIHDA